MERHSKSLRSFFFVVVLTLFSTATLTRLQKGINCQVDLEDQTAQGQHSVSFLGDDVMSTTQQQPAKGRKLLPTTRNESAGGFYTVSAALEYLVTQRSLPTELVWKDVDTYPAEPLPITTFYSSHCLQFPLPKRRAFVMGHDFSVPYDLSTPDHRRTLELLRLFHPVEDVIFYTLEKNVDAMRALNEGSIQEFNLKVVGFEVPAVSRTVKEDLDSMADCCPGDNEYLKLNVFGLDEYDAIIFIDNDQRVLGNLDVVFQCAHKYFVSTTGQGEALNGGFFAFRPSKELFQDISNVLQYAEFDKSSGFNGTGYGHHDNVDKHLEFYSAAGPQGFFWYYFYLLPATQKEKEVPEWRQEGAHMLRCEVNGMCDFQKGFRRTIKYPCLNHPDPPLLLHKFCTAKEYGDENDMPFGFVFCTRTLAKKVQKRVATLGAGSESASIRADIQRQVVSGIHHCHHMWNENKRLAIAEMIRHEEEQLSKDAAEELKSGRLTVEQMMTILLVNHWPEEKR